MIPVTFVVVDNSSPMGSPLENVVVRVYNEAGDTFVTEGTTDENGELVLLLTDMTSYWVRFFKVEYAFDNRLRITVDSTAPSNTFDIVGRDLVELPPSAVPELCRASGYVVNVAGEPHGGAVIEFNATDLPKVVSNRAVVRSKIIVQSQKDGYVEVELVRGGVYDVVAQASEDEVIRTKVPDAAAVNITELIWPYVAQVKWDPPGPLNLAPGESVEILPIVVLSSGVETPFDLDEKDTVEFGQYIQIEDSVEGVVRLSYNQQTDTLLVTARDDPGTTTLVATLREDVEAKRLPEPTRDLQDLVIVVS
jgi:hypothetical protein